MESAVKSVRPTESLDFKQAMRAVVASVNVITCCHDGEHYGLTATAFSSVCAEPPTVLICVNESASACERIRLSRQFCVNVLAPGMEELAAAFAGRIAPEKRFAEGHWRTLESGNLMVEGCAAVFDCEVKTVFQEGSHWVVVGVVRQCEYAPTPALVYANGKYGRFETAAVGA
ncbi:flavin reductase family protein [Pseudomonas aeruginosa]|jgi:flavin reductase|nr:flavin reductase family protein [Pseudomonas aeruginosa]MCS9139114.1 flavin reductase family protein [Pseudomonas aeruginosa]MCS9211905.1 flavin reductase family protein [Pseudomonas aeruginosa]